MLRISLRSRKPFCLWKRS